MGLLHTAVFITGCLIGCVIVQASITLIFFLSLAISTIILPCVNILLLCIYCSMALLGMSQRAVEMLAKFRGRSRARVGGRAGVGFRGEDGEVGTWKVNFGKRAEVAGEEWAEEADGEEGEVLGWEA
jgi:hypothetical protein